LRRFSWSNGSALHDDSEIEEESINQINYQLWGGPDATVTGSDDWEPLMISNHERDSLSAHRKWPDLDANLTPEKIMRQLINQKKWTNEYISNHLELC
jgi:hypothetical protein